jgi:hypothetical protein
MEDAVSDLEPDGLETRLRECLTHRADGIDPSSHLVHEARARSHDISRRRYGLSALAVVPATAAVVFGSIALANGSSPAVRSTDVRATATATASASITPRAVGRDAHGNCPTITVPDLKRLQRKAARLPRNPVSVARFLKGHKGLQLIVENGQKGSRAHPAGRFAYEVVPRKNVPGWLTHPNTRGMKIISVSPFGCRFQRIGPLKSLQSK